MNESQTNSPPSTEDKQFGGFLALLKSDRLWLILALLLVCVIGWFYSGLIDPQMLGFTHDDGVYAITGKALSQGKGFTLLHVVGQPSQIKYPVMYPLILSLVWLINPHFPQNLLLMNLLTIGFTMGAFWLLYLFLRQAARFPGWLAMLVIALTAANFFVMYFYSTIMSEAPYLFFSCLTLWYFTRQQAREERFSRGSIALLILFSLLTFHTRVLGIALMGAIGTWLLLQRQWRNTLLYGGGCLLFGLLPWIVWLKTQTPVVTEMNYPLVNAYSNYGLELSTNFTTGRYLDLTMQTFSSFMEDLLEDMFPLIPNFFKIYPRLENPTSAVLFIAVNVLGTYLLIGYFLLQGISAVRKGAENNRLQAQAFSVPALYLFYYFLLIVFWSYPDQMTRFITVLLPLFWMYTFKPWLPFLPACPWGVRRLPEAVAEDSNKMQEVPHRNEADIRSLPVEGNSPKTTGRRLTALLTAVLIMAVGILSLWPTPNSYRIVHLSRSRHWVDSGKFPWLWGEYQDSFAWIRKNLPKDAPLGAPSDTVFHLYTEHPTYYIFFASLRRVNGKYTAESFPLLLKSLDHYGVQYLVAEPHMQQRVVQHKVNSVVKALLEEYPERFEQVYKTPRGAIKIYRILPPK